jgi:hypothetical protein
VLVWLVDLAALADPPLVLTSVAAALGLREVAGRALTDTLAEAAGAYAADPTLTGRANFGFVSKYQKGATIPTGVTEFQFKVANLNFHSNTYEWLVIGGPKAQFKGRGTINGTGDYGFMLRANDGQVAGGGGVDRFRIKIWDRATGAIVYDNQMGEADTANASTAVGGGSIVIHN